MSEEKHCCEYHDCNKDGDCFDVILQAWLCEEHVDKVDDKTGYCGASCRLGYGCDQSC